MTTEAVASPETRDGRPVVPGLPWLLVRLKVRLLRNRARSNKGGAVMLVVACTLAIVYGGFAAVVAFAAGHSDSPRVSRAVIVLGATAIAVGWSVLPLMSFGSDESLDPARLVLFPLARGPLIRGLLLTAFVGPAPTAVILVVIGAALGYPRGPVSAVITFLAMALLLAFSGAAARTLSSALAAGLTSRRGRDAKIVLVSVLALSVQLVRFIRVSSDVVDRLVDIARWTPPGMLGQAVMDGRNGSYLIAMAELVPAAICIPLLLAWWSRSLDRATTVVPGGETQTRHRAETDLPLLFERLPFLGHHRWGAVTARELRYAFREPRRKVNLVNGILIGVGFPIFVAIRSDTDGSSRVVLLATMAGYIAVLGSNNQFGFDGAALWLDMAAGDTMRDVLIGKNVAVMLEVMPIVTGVGVVLAAMTGGWVYLPAAIVLATAGLGVGLAAANVISVRVPLRLPESRNPYAGAGGGQGCATALVVLVCVFVQNFLLLPVFGAVAATFVLGPSWLVLVLPLALAYGVVMWLVGLWLASEWGTARRPEILIAVDPARSN